MVGLLFLVPQLLAIMRRTKYFVNYWLRDRYQLRWLANILSCSIAIIFKGKNMLNQDAEVLELANNILKENGYPEYGKELDLVIKALVVGVGIGAMDSELTKKIFAMDTAKPPLYIV